MNKFNQAGTPAATPTTTSEKDLLVAAYQALDTERRAQLLSYAQYLVDQSQTTTEQRVKAMEFN
ncbi:MAG: hypothetical protein EBR82_77105, partial [Caulobacteraceae bacterium]|nr:hypothetical protein [Caulobacteraceae bacterium]